MKHRIFLLLICFILLWGCPKKEEISPKEEGATDKEKTFNVLETDISDILNITEDLKTMNMVYREIQQPEFSLGMVEYKFSKDIAVSDTEANTIEINVKVIDSKKARLYPPIAAHGLFFRFGVEKGTETEYKKKEKYNGWEMVYSYDKTKKEANFTAMKQDIFIISDFVDMDLKSSKELFKSFFDKKD